MHRGIRWIVIGALSFVAVVVASACGSDNGDSDGGDTTQNGSMTVKMLDSVFQPDHLTVKAGTTVKFELPNLGVLPHNMHIASARGVYRESPWISQPEPINGGKTGSLTWEVPAEAGTYKFRCDYHESTMFGTITVEP
jgi:plastocyanin